MGMVFVVDFLNCFRSFLDDAPFKHYKPAKDCQSFVPFYGNATGEDRNALKEVLLQDPVPSELKDNEKLTPMHIAAKKGKVNDMMELLQIHRDYVKIVNTHGETPLHVPVKHGQEAAVRFLAQATMETLLFREVVNRMDFDGNTALHLATATKQTKMLKILLEESPAYGGLVEVNAKNHAGFTALDILYSMPEHGERDLEMEKLLRRAGALRGRDIVAGKNHDKLPHYPPHPQLTRLESLIARYQALLYMAIVIVIFAYHASLRPPRFFKSDIEIVDDVYDSEVEEENAVINQLYVLFNSIAFFTSMALITILTHELPIKPWLLISVISAIGAYMCSTMATWPQQVMSVILVGCFICIAALLKCVAFDKKVINFLCATRIRII